VISSSSSNTWQAAVSVKRYRACDRRCAGEP
jgi:hypothetical protein